jgi:hypothetical protein
LRRIATPAGLDICSGCSPARWSAAVAIAIVKS